MNRDYTNIFSVKDKVVVITGGAGLIGKYLTTGYAQAGAKVYILDNNEESADELVNRFLEEGLSVQFIKGDVTCEKSIDNAINSILFKEERIDTWINSAYPRTKDWGSKFEDVTFESWRKNVDMQLNSYFICCQKISRVMKNQNKGNIINFASIYGVVGPKFSIYEGTEMTMPVAYSAIKGGIVNLTRYLATYLGRYNIRVNAVCPGGIFDNQNPIFINKYNANTPIGRMGKPEEMVGPVMFLSSEAASYITGHILMVDGGWTAQ